MKYILLDGVIQNAGTKDFKELVGKVAKELGLSLPGYCCNSDDAPINGSVLSYDIVKKRYVPVTAAGVTSVTNLTYTANTANGIVVNSNGTGFTIPLATSVLAGLMSPAQFSALASITTTANTTTIQQGDTFMQINDPATGGITFQVDGVAVGGVTLVGSIPKWTLNGILDPVVYAGTPITTTQRNTYGNVAGYLIYNSATGQYEYNNGTTWQPMGGAGTITSVFGRSTATIVSANGDYTASQVTNVPSGNISAVTVQAALNELDSEKANNIITGFVSGAGAITATDTVLQAINKLDGNMVANDAAYVHKTGAETISGIKTFTAQPVGITATSIINTPSGNVVATTVQSAITELDSEKVDKSLLTAKGSIIAASFANAPVELLVGTNGQILSSDSTTASGLKWITPAISKYNQTFLTTDFVVGATESTLTILQSVHLKGTEPVVVVFQDMGGGIWQEYGTVIQKNAAGDVFIKVSNGATVNGKVTII
jgi:hypothetical protein